MKGSLEVDENDDPVLECLTHEFRVLSTTCDEGEAEDDEAEVANGTIKEFSVSYDDYMDEDDWEGNFQWMDAVSQEACDLHNAISANREVVSDDGIRDIVYLDRLIVEREHQGQGIGSLTVHRLLRNWSRHAGVPSHFFLLAHPIEPGRPSREERRAWQEREPEAFRQASQRVRRFYERLGFQALGDTDFMAFDLRYKGPEPAHLQNH
jgi:GNAT superfamily N-acetyltransferase